MKHSLRALEWGTQTIWYTTPRKYRYIMWRGVPKMIAQVISEK